MTTETNAGDRRWLALVLLASAQFLAVLDGTVTNVALPYIQRDLDFSSANLQWVVNAYALTFGGFLMLGGRAADLLGRRAAFMTGIALFAGASLAAGLSQSEGMLIAARAVQGLGGAILTPAALSIITTTFPEGTERNKALAVWGAVAGAGGAVGSLLGGVVTDVLSWEWVFFINVPIAALILLATPVLVPESRAEGARRGYDVAGAVTITAGLALLIFTLVNTTQHGWASTRTLLGFAGTVALLAAFVVRETTARDPIIRLGILRSATRAGANLTAILGVAALLGMWYFLSLYMQDVLGASAMRTGLQFLPLAVTIFVSSVLTSSLVTRLGVRPVLTAGLVLSAVGLAWFSRVSADGSYLSDLLFPSLVVAVGLGMFFVSGTLAATAGVAPHEAGLASGLITTSQQVGGAVGLGVLATLATDRTATLLAEGTAAPVAATAGFQLAFLVGAGFAVAGAIVAVLFVKPPRHQVAPDGEPEPVAIA